MVKRTVQLLLVTCVMAGAAWAANDPMVGEWKLNSQKSKLMKDEMKVTRLGGNKYSFDFGGGHPETIVVDGTDQAGNGGTTFAVTAVSPEEWRGVRKKDGRVEITGIWTLSKDGNRLHDDFTGVEDNGKTIHLIYVYERKGGGTGFAGDWVSTSEQIDTAYVVKMQAYEGDGLSIVFTFEGITKNVKFDGKDYPNAGSGVKTVSSARRVNERTIELTNKIGGKVAGTQVFSVSEDGKTLTMTGRAQGSSESNVMVFDRE
jgi:hypothetical protein